MSDYVPTVCCIESLRIAEKAGHVITKHDVQRALERGLLPLVKFAVEERPYVFDKVDYPHETAAANGHIEMLDYLLVNRKCRSIEAVGRAAATTGQLAVLKWLIERNDVNELISLPYTALLGAGCTGNWSVFDYLMENGAPKHTMLCDRASKWGLPALKKVRSHNVPWDKENMLHSINLLTDEVREFIEQSPAIEGDL
jgi:hypothetical protein